MSEKDPIQAKWSRFSRANDDVVWHFQITLGLFCLFALDPSIMIVTSLVTGNLHEVFDNLSTA